MEEVKDVPVDSSQPVVEAESTPAAVEAAPAPAQEQMVPYSRFKEVIEEKKQFQQLAQQLAARQSQGETQKQIEQDPYAGMDAEQAHFYRNLDKRMQAQIQSEAQRYVQPILKQNEALARQVSELMVGNFRQINSDVPPDSKEEAEIANLIASGISPERAAWAVMGPKRVEAARIKQQAAVQTKVQQKIQANMDGAGIPTNNGLPPPAKKMSIKELVEENAKKMGLNL